MAFIKSIPLRNDSNKDTGVNMTYWRFSRDKYEKDNVNKCVRCFIDGYLSKEAYLAGKGRITSLGVAITYQSLGITDLMTIRDFELIPKLYLSAKTEVFFEKTVKKPVTKEITIKVKIDEQNESGEWSQVIEDETKIQFWWSVEAFDTWRTHNPEVHAQPFVVTDTTEEDVTEKEYPFSDAIDDL